MFLCYCVDRLKVSCSNVPFIGYRFSYSYNRRNISTLKPVVSRKSLSIFPQKTNLVSLEKATAKCDTATASFFYSRLLGSHLYSGSRAIEPLTLRPMMLLCLFKDVVRFKFLHLSPHRMPNSNKKTGRS